MCRIERHRFVDQGNVITAGGISYNLETGFHLLLRSGHDEAFVDSVAKIMEYERQWALMKAGRPAVA